MPRLGRQGGRGHYMVRNAHQLAEGRSRHQPSHHQPSNVGRNTSNTTLGIVGLGRIGSAIARRADGFECGFSPPNKNSGLHSSTSPSLGAFCPSGSRRQAAAMRANAVSPVVPGQDAWSMPNGNTSMGGGSQVDVVTPAAIWDITRSLGRIR